MKKFLILSLVVAFVLVTTPACKKFVWNPVGTWSFQVDVDGWPLFTELVTLAGSETGGSLTGWTKFNPDSTAGTWTKSGDYTLTIAIDYWNIFWNNVVELTGTTTKSTPNAITLTGTFTETFFSSFEHAMTVTATKTSNLQ